MLGNYHNYKLIFNYKLSFVPFKKYLGSLSKEMFCILITIRHRHLETTITMNISTSCNSTSLMVLLSHAMGNGGCESYNRGFMLLMIVQSYTVVVWCITVVVIYCGIVWWYAGGIEL